ncbi:MAG: nucleotide modification associated domain-containing protein [Peptostreptococcaceae bacterium]|nr:nucleotide modification associated domain-containing protein [Peptostreptococcaceae bacterium]
MKHRELCEELNQIYEQKNRDYGDSFSETYRILGILSAVTRITDKVNRLQSLCTKEQKVSGERIIDTLKDLANYAMMTVMEIEREQMRDIEARRESDMIFYP